VKQTLDGIATFVSNDLFTGYALYTFAFVAWTFFRKPGRMLSSWDDSANLLVRYAGIFVCLHGLFTLISIDWKLDTPFNPYPWILLLFWIVASQLLWFEAVRRHRLLRIFIAGVLFFSFEKFVIIVTSFHRDYLPSRWESDVFPHGLWVAIALALITKAVTFVVFAYVLTYLRSRFITRKINQEP
jgi:uncharacterized membrane protein (DUF485 family)